MTIDEFIEFLKCTPRTWAIYNNGAIRNGPGGTFGIYPDCPVTATQAYMTGISSKYGAGDWLNDYAKLQLNLFDAQSITHAADNFEPHDRNLRVRLLAACGLNGIR